MGTQNTGINGTGAYNGQVKMGGGWTHPPHLLCLYVHSFQNSIHNEVDRDKHVVLMEVHLDLKVSVLIQGFPSFLGL